MLETAERFGTDQVTVGKEIQFRVRTNVMAENEVAIRTGALAIGRVKAIEPATYNNPAEIRIELTIPLCASRGRANDRPQRTGTKPARAVYGPGHENPSNSEPILCTPPTFLPASLAMDSAFIFDFFSSFS
jgi:hypothetical protein